MHILFRFNIDKTSVPKKLLEHFINNKIKQMTFYHRNFHRPIKKSGFFIIKKKNFEYKNISYEFDTVVVVVH